VREEEVGTANDSATARCSGHFLTQIPDLSDR